MRLSTTQIIIAKALLAHRGAAFIKLGGVKNETVNDATKLSSTRKPEVLEARLGLTGATIIEGIALGFFSAALNVVLQRANVHALAPADEMMQTLYFAIVATPIPFLLTLLGALPIFGELLFRGVPYLLFLAARRVLHLRGASLVTVSWFIGLAAAVAFALAPLMLLAKMGDVKTFFPISLLFLGLWLWRTLQRRGFVFCVLLHFVHNLVIVALLYLSRPAG